YRATAAPRSPPGSRWPPSPRLTRAWLVTGAQVGSFATSRRKAHRRAGLSLGTGRNPLALAGLFPRRAELEGQRRQRNDEKNSGNCCDHLCCVKFGFDDNGCRRPTRKARKTPCFARVPRVLRLRSKVPCCAKILSEPHVCSERAPAALLQQSRHSGLSARI